MRKGISVKTIISNYKILLIVVLIACLTVSLQSLLLSPKSFQEGGILYNQYNNYTIFKMSFYHLKDNKDLYALYPQEHWDLFKYSPSFAAFFGIFAFLPDWIGLNLWNLINALILLAAIYYMPKFSNYQKGLIIIIILIELITSLQNSQSNALIAGLIILAFGLLEKEKYLFATICIVFTVFIKIFGLVGFALFLFYPKKWRLIGYTILWVILLLLMPLIFIDLLQYKFLLKSYCNMLSNDHTLSYGYSVMGLLRAWSGYNLNKIYIAIAGVILFLLPFYKIGEYKNYAFRLYTLASILIWIVIFNHKAESPTFIIAMAGVALWFVNDRKSKINMILLIVAFILTSLSPTDIFPRSIREEYVKPLALKALPCILVWLKIIYDLIVLKDDKLTTVQQTSGKKHDYTE